MQSPNFVNRGGLNLKREIIPYQPYLKDLAKKLRQNMTFSEVLLWNQIKNGQMMGYDFDRQRPIGNYIVDFYCKDMKLALEVDGITHLEEEAKERDELRQNELQTQGVSFLRFDALLVINKIESVIRQIIGWIQEYEEKNGISHYAETKKKKLENPVSRRRADRKK